MRLPLILLLSLLCALALLASPALAATTIANTGGQVTVTGDAGDNHLTVSPGAAGTVRVSDPGTVSALGCTAVDATTAQCATTEPVRVNLGDGADSLSAAAGTSVGITVDGGGGNDTFHLQDAQADTVTCGGGADDASDVDPQDTFVDDCEEIPATAGPPVTTIVDRPADDAADASARFQFTASEPATFQCKLDGVGDFDACPANPTFNGLAQGGHTLDVRAIDRIGNVETVPAAFAWTVDTVQPTVTITGRPDAATQSTSASFTFAADDPTDTVDCRLDTGAFVPCRVLGGTQSTTETYYPSLGEGPHTVTVQATDAAGNIGTASYMWRVDLTPPSASFIAAPAALTNNTSPLFAVSVSETVALTCSFDSAVFSSCTSPQSLLGVADGTHTFRVKSTDAADHATVIAYTWEQDTVRPQTQLTGGPATSAPVNSSSATLTFASTAGTRFDCALDGGAWQACATPMTYTALANGTHTFSVRAVDAAGNVDGTPSTRTWAVGVDGAPTAKISVTRDGDGFALSAAGSADPESGALVYRWLQNGKPAGGTATVHYAAPDHETRDVFTLTVTDPGGQRGQATVAMRTRASTDRSTLEADDVIRFASGTRLAPGAKARIAALRAAIASGTAAVRIEGFARSGAGAARVSKARAQAVRGLLVKGVSPAPKVTVVARGAAGAVASNATSAGRARNDRAVVTVTYAGAAPRLISEEEGNARVSRSNAPRPAATGAGALKLFAFYSAVPGALKRLEEVGGRVDVLAPNWYTLAPSDASIHGGAPNAKVMTLSKKLGFKVWPVVNATMSGSPLIDTPAGRTKVVTQIAGLAARYRLAGVTLDMEEMLPRQKGSYSALVAQLASTLHAKHRKLAIYAVRRTATDVDDGAAAYDWPALARSADLVLGSGYNEHSAVTTPGPITTQAGFDALAGYAAQTSRTKVAPTIGAFGYQWSDGAAGRMISSADAERRWPVRAEVGSADGRSDATGATRTFFESAEDLWAREQAARRAGVQWIGLFSLGREPDRYWERSLAK